MNSSSSLQASKRTQLRRSLPSAISLVGWILAGITLNIFIFSSLPIKLSLPEWQLKIVGNAAGSFATLLLGLLLVSIAPLIGEMKDSLIKSGSLAQALCKWLAIFMVLLIPVQLHAGYSVIMGQKQIVTTNIRQYRIFVQSIRNAQTEAQVRSLIAKLNQPPTMPDKISVPFDKFKETLASTLDDRAKNLSNSLAKQLGGAWLEFWKDSLRISIQSLLLALGFYGLSKTRSSDRKFP
jgi:hypothetical protein